MSDVPMNAVWSVELLNQRNSAITYSARSFSTYCFIFSKVIVHVYITFIAVFFRCKQVKSRFITPFTSLDRSSNLVFISLNTVMKSPPLSNGMICLGMLKCVLYKVPLKINYVDASFSKPMTGHCKTADKPCKDRFSPSTGSVWLPQTEREKLERET